MYKIYFLNNIMTQKSMVFVVVDYNKHCTGVFNTAESFTYCLSSLTRVSRQSIFSSRSLWKHYNQQQPGNVCYYIQWY